LINWSRFLISHEFVHQYSCSELLNICFSICFLLYLEDVQKSKTNFELLKLILKGKMMNPKAKKNSKKVVSSDYNSNELIVLFEKLHSDFNMLDSKMKEILNSKKIEVKNSGNIIKTFNETNKELNTFAEQRNKKIKDLLKIIKS